MQIDGLGKRYGLLPSKILKEGDTFDLYVLDAALSYELFHQKKAENKGQIPASAYNQEQLLTIFNKTQNDKGNAQNKK